MEYASESAGISALVKLLVDAIKLIFPSSSSAVIVTVASVFSILLSSLSVLKDNPVITVATFYSIVVQSIVVFAVAIGLTEVQKKAEAKRSDSGESDRKIG